MDKMALSKFSPIKDDRNFLFWSALNSSIESEDPSLAKEWRDVALAQLDTEKLAQLQSRPFESRIKELDLDAAYCSLLKQYSGKKYESLIMNSESLLKEIIEIHANGEFLKEASDENSDLIMTALGFFALVIIEREPLDNLEALESMFSDSRMEQMAKENEDTIELSANKKVVILSVYSTLKRKFSQESDYFCKQLTGLIAVELEILDTEDQHLGSERTTEYSRYLSNTVSDILSRRHKKKK